MYCLSCNEYIVLETIRTLSGNPKYDYWCVMSAEKMSNTLDLSESTIKRAKKKLEEVGLIEKRESSNSDTACRPTEEWMQWLAQGTHDLIISMKNKKGEISGYVPSDTGGVKMTRQLGQNDTATGVKMTPNNNKDNNSNNNKGIVLKNLIKWFESMEDVNSPERLANKYFKLYSPDIIKRALNNSCCTSRNEFVNLCEHYTPKPITT